jgi:hypothetical protein
VKGFISDPSVAKDTLIGNLLSFPSVSAAIKSTGDKK